jgi:uncharacterized protein (TIGR02391 family)
MADERPWFQLAPEELTALPPDELGLRILVGLVPDPEGSPASEKRTSAVERINTGGNAPREAKQAVVEAWWWLISKGLIAPDAQNQDDESWLPTRLGVDVAARADGLARLRAGERIDIDLHPRIADDIRSEFLRGRFEAAAWSAMREVEISLREASNADPYAYGQGLLNHAFGKGGVLIDPALPDAEQQAIANLFRGAIGALKNPHSHRQIHFDDATEAAEIVIFASFLLRVLDRLRPTQRTQP